jgi:hypothetical protein
MTLTRLLGINLRLLRFEDDRGLQLAEEVWRLQGAPFEGQILADAIETCLQRCTEEGIPYPPILLKRKKQIERGTWSPDTRGNLVDVSTAPVDGESACSKCGGSGYVLIEGGRHAKMCECNKWVRSQKVQ